MKEKMLVKNNSIPFVNKKTFHHLKCNRTCEVCQTFFMKSIFLLSFLHIIAFLHQQVHVMLARKYLIVHVEHDKL